mmetsp:Transcript_964/g.3209  ORF Transcript_964/g.3209 Transcript_964/m.3209 type:complete len:333 (-) Transcript_964:335-1333(-)
MSVASCCRDHTGLKCCAVPTNPHVTPIPQEFEIVNRDTGRMKRFLIFEGVVANNLDLTEFPFDTNSVDIEFGFVSHWRTRDGSKSGTSPMVPIYLVRSVSDPKEGDPIGIYWNKKIPEWELYGASWYLKTHVDKAGYTQQQLMLSFLVGRHVKFYALKVLLPLYLLLINFAADFLLPTKDLPSRSANTMTGFLAAFAFLYVIAGMLPKVEFLTRIDQIILVTLIGMTMCGIEAWVVYLLDEQQGTETAEQVNWIAGSVLGGLYVLINLAILVPGIRHKAHQLALHRVRAQTTARHVRGPAVTNKVVPVPGGAPPDEQGVTEWHIELCTSPKP